MIKDETREAIKVMQAFVDGAEIECVLHDKADDWTPMLQPSWNFNLCKYRIKKAPRTFWITDNRSAKYPHVLTANEYKQYFLADQRYFKVQEVIE